MKYKLYKKGEVVNVFDDPMTETKLQGKARVISCWTAKRPELEIGGYLVEFLDGPKMKYDRWIKNRK